MQRGNSGHTKSIQRAYRRHSGLTFRRCPGQCISAPTYNLHVILEHIYASHLLMPSARNLSQHCKGLDVQLGLFPSFSIVSRFATQWHRAALFFLMPNASKLLLASCHRIIQNSGENTLLHFWVANYCNYATTCPKSTTAWLNIGAGWVNNEKGREVGKRMWMLLQIGRFNALWAAPLLCSSLRKSASSHSSQLRTAAVAAPEVP